MDILLDLGLVTIVAVVAGWALGRAGITRNLAYMVAGVVAGFVLRQVIQPTLVASFDIVTAAALGFVTFGIGEDMSVSSLRHMGVRGPSLAVIQALVTFVLVCAGTIVLGRAGAFHLEHLVPEALVLAATATSTAPEATFEVIRRLRARGPVTEAVSVAVTLDDTVGIIVFDVCVVVARAMMGEGVEPGWGVVAASMRELGLSIVLGLIAGAAYGGAVRLLRSRSQTRVLGIGMVLLVIGLSRTWELSPLLSCLTLGGVIATMLPSSELVFEDMDEWSVPLQVVFFFLAGATANFGLLRQLWPIAAAYVLLRVVGKLLGSRLAAVAVHVSPSVRRYLGQAMLPQAGLAVGHALLITSLFPDLAYITTTVIVSVLLFDVVGSWMTARALVQSGEAQLPGQATATR